MVSFMKCANCGKEIKQNSRFCPACGFPLAGGPDSFSADRQDGAGTEDWKTRLDFPGIQDRKDPLDEEKTQFDIPYREMGPETGPENNGDPGFSGKDAGKAFPAGNEVTSMGNDDERTRSFFDGPERKGPPPLYDTPGRKGSFYDDSYPSAGDSIFEDHPGSNPYQGRYYDDIPGEAPSFENDYGRHAGYDPAGSGFSGDIPPSFGNGDPSGMVPPDGYRPYDSPPGPAEGPKKPKKNVKRIGLITLAVLLACSLTGYGANYHHNKVRADRVIRMIDQLGDPNAVTLTDRNDIDVARKAFDQLTDKQKEQVDNDLSLFSAESVVDQLERKENQEQAGLTDEEIARQDQILEDREQDLSRQPSSKKASEQPYYYVLSNPVSWGAYKVSTSKDPLTMRSGPGYKYKTLAKIPKGSIVYVYGYYNGWYYIDYNGQWGWSNAKYLKEQYDQPIVEKAVAETPTYLEVEGNASYMGDYKVVVKELNMRSGPGTGYSSRKILSKGYRLSAYGSCNGWLYVEHAGQWGWVNGKSKYVKPYSDPVPPSEAVTIMNNPEKQGTYAIDANKLTLRTGPGTEFDQITVLKRGDRVTGYNTYKGWRYVQYNDQWGWMSDKYLKLEKGILLEPGSQEYMGDFKVTTKKTDLTLRYGPGKSYGKVTSAPKGAIVSAYARDDKWYFVEYKGKKGWADGTYLQEESESKPKDELVKPSSEGYIADFTVAGSSSEQSLRYGPGTEYESPGSLPKGSEVTAYGKEGSWYYIYCPSKNLEGWIKAENLEEVKEIEEEDTDTESSEEESESSPDSGESESADTSGDSSGSMGSESGSSDSSDSGSSSDASGSPGVETE